MRQLRTKDVLADPHARRFADVLRKHPEEVEVVLAIINEHDVARRLVESEIHHDRPAFAAVVRQIEGDALLAPLLARRSSDALRFRQLCGVLVKLKMTRLGWSTTGSKGSLAAIAKVFRQAERYVPSEKPA